MERDTKERIISMINWGRSVADVVLQDGTRRRLVLRPATIEEKARAALVYLDAIAEARGLGLMSEPEAITFYVDAGQWSKEEETQLQGLQDDIHKLKRGLLDYLFKVEQLEKLRATIRRAEQAFVDKYTKREALLVETAERYATTAEQRFLVGRVTQTIDGEPYWPRQENFDTCTDAGLIRSLVSHYFVESHLGERTLREVARTDPWRTIWGASKHTGVLFDGPPGGWSYNQAQLVRWSHLYDVVYESVDRPSDAVVEDDDLLDSWIIRQNEKVADYAKKKESEGILGVTQNGPGRNEVFVVADAEGAKRVYDMNDSQARRIVKTTQELAAARGEVKESDLPHSQQEIRMKAMEMEKQHIARR